MEEIKELKTVMVHYKCDKCENGYMKVAKYNFTVLHEQQTITHVCDSCGRIEGYEKSYPHLSYEEVK